MFAALAKARVLRALPRIGHAHLKGGRNLLTLAIETSCDDTSVAILEKANDGSVALHFHDKVTADNSAFAGIHPATAVESHQRSLPGLVARSLRSLPASSSELPEAQMVAVIEVQKGCTQRSRKRKPDFVSVTRGPGISACLATGLDCAKGLAIAWQIPLLGVHHMQAHALSPRLCHALDGPKAERAQPHFPFLTLLVSGGHTLLVHSQNLCDHAILADTTDIAIGDALDKMARTILPRGMLDGQEIMYGRVLERFAFKETAQKYWYHAPTSRAREIMQNITQWGWALPVPLAQSKRMQFTFSGLETAVKRICEQRAEHMKEAERAEMARESMRVAFEHLATRVAWALRDLKAKGQEVSALVMSGGVASNGFLRVILRKYLDTHCFRGVQLIFPPIELCTDNAAMIGWAGMEMYEQGWTTGLACRAMRKWSLDSGATDGGILGASEWHKSAQGQIRSDESTRS